MNKETIRLKNNRYSTAVLLFAALILSSLLFGNARAASFAQDSLRKTVYGTEKSSPNKAAKKVVNKKTDDQIVKRQRSLPVSKSEAKKTRVVKKNSNGSSKAAPLDVTFITQQPDLEIWLDDENIGSTNNNAELTTKLVPSVYRVTVKKDNRTVFPLKEIAVSDKQTEFRLFTELQSNAAKPESEPEPKRPVIEEETKPAEVPAGETSDRIREILENYADPAKTDTVSEKDWELVFQSVQLGQLQGYTAVQIEAQRWFASGQIELARGNYQNAYTAFRKSIEFMPKSALPFYGLGNAYVAANQPSEALQAYQQALRLEPKMAMAYKGVGDAQRLLKNRKEALVAYRNAVQLGYIVPETRLRLATMLLETNRAKEGFGQLEELAATAPSAEVYAALGDAYLLLKKNLSAVESYRKAIEYKPDFADAYFKLGNIYFDEREYSKAKESLEKALELDPKGKIIDLSEARKKVRLAAVKIK